MEEIYSTTDLAKQAEAAVKFGDLDSVKALYQSAASEASTQKGLLSTIATAAVRTKQVAVLRWAYSEGFRPNEQSLNDIFYEAACEALSVPIWRVILSHGYDLNKQSSEFIGDGLCESAFRGNLEVFIFLLENGADPNRGNCISEQTASVWAITSDESPAHPCNEMLRQLLKHGWKNRREGTHIAAAETGNLEALRILVEDPYAPADLEEVEAWWHAATLVERDEWGTALYRAAYKGQEEPVRYLLERGASPGFKDGKGRGCLWAARVGENVAVIQLMDEAGAE